MENSKNCRAQTCFYGSWCSAFGFFSDAASFPICFGMFTAIWLLWVCSSHSIPSAARNVRQDFVSYLLCLSLPSFNVRPQTGTEILEHDWTCSQHVSKHPDMWGVCVYIENILIHSLNTFNGPRVSQFSFQKKCNETSRTNLSFQVNGFTGFVRTTSQWPQSNLRSCYKHVYK